jgi:cardiolipin synthase
VTVGGFELNWLYDVLEWAIRAGALIIVPFRRRFTAAAWLLLIFFLPIPGLLLFLAIGQPRFPKFRIEQFREVRPMLERLAEALKPHRPEIITSAALFAERLGYLPAVGGNAAELLDDYDEVIGRLIADIDAARTRVSLVVYIFADDAVGQSVIDALARAVSRGVDCKVLLDPVGSLHWVRRTVRLLRAAGVHTREALPLHWLRRRTRRDMRNHRKLFIIDGRIGYAGSQNIVRKDFRRGVVNRELTARCTGPIVSEMEAVFLAETGTAPPPAIEPAQSTGGAILQLLPSGPEYPLEGYQTLLVWQLHQASRRAIITTPYFIPDQDVLAALRTAVARGVEVDLILSRIVDQRIVNLAQRSFYDDLLRAGVRIHLFNRYLLHAKNVSIDGELAVVGSSNVDLRSFQLNEEVSLLLFDPESVRSVESVQRGYIEQSEELRLEAWEKRSRVIMVAENFARLVSPLL